MREVSPTEIQRPQKEKKYIRLTLSGNDIEQMSYKNYWWGMPSYEMGDATPVCSNNEYGMKLIRRG